MSLFSAKYSGQTREKSWHSSKLNQTNCGGGGDDNDDDDDYAHLYLSLIALPWMQDSSHIDCPVSFTNIVNQALGF